MFHNHQIFILNLIKNQSEHIKDLAIVGHEPSLSETLNFLVGHTRPDLNFFYNNVFSKYLFFQVLFHDHLFFLPIFYHKYEQKKL